MKQKVIWASWCEKDIVWDLWKTQKKAKKGGRPENRNIIGSVCNLSRYFNTPLNKKKIYAITITEG